MTRKVIIAPRTRSQLALDISLKDHGVIITYDDKNNIIDTSVFDNKIQGRKANLVIVDEYYHPIDLQEYASVKKDYLKYNKRRTKRKKK